MVENGAPDVGEYRYNSKSGIIKGRDYEYEEKRTEVITTDQ